MRDSHDVDLLIDAVAFTLPGETRSVPCLVDVAALEVAPSAGLVLPAEVFKADRALFEEIARRKFASGETAADRTVRIHASDLAPRLFSA